MASYNELNALIDAYINRNGVQAITGQILNGVLKAMVEQLGRGYTIMGAATPTTDPGTPDGPECYFASETGTYTDFDGLQVAPGELALLCYTPSDGWTKATIYEGFRQVGATIDGNVGTPSVGVSYANGVLSFDFHNMKGNPGQNGQDGAAAGFGTIGADITGGVGTPGVSVESSGPATAKNLQFHFTNLKGETGVTSVVATVDNTTGTPACTVSLVGQQLTLAFSGLKGAQGDTGSSVDYPFTIVNNLTTDDATQALSAAQGVVLEGEITQLEAKVTDLTFGDFQNYGFFPTEENLPENASRKGVAYVGTSSPFAIYNFDGTEWVDSGTTYIIPNGMPQFLTPQMYGAVGDGQTDDLAAFQQMYAYASTHGSVCIIPEGIYLCSMQIEPKSNTVTVVSPNAKFTNPRPMSASFVWSFSNVQNVKVYFNGAEIDGLNAKSHAVSFSLATDVEIHDVYVSGVAFDSPISSSDHDGIYIGSDSHFIRVVRGSVRYAIRNGITIADADNVTIDGVKIYGTGWVRNSAGTRWQGSVAAGIDVEPNTKFKCFDIIIKNCHIDHCRRGGVFVTSGKRIWVFNNTITDVPEGVLVGQGGAASKQDRLGYDKYMITGYSEDGWVTLDAANDAEILVGYNAYFYNGDTDGQKDDYPDELHNGGTQSGTKITNFEIWKVNPNNRKQVKLKTGGPLLTTGDISTFTNIPSTIQYSYLRIYNSEWTSDVVVEKNTIYNIGANEDVALNLTKCLDVVQVPGTIVKYNIMRDSVVNQGFAVRGSMNSIIEGNIVKNITGSSGFTNNLSSINIVARDNYFEGCNGYPIYAPSYYELTIDGLVAINCNPASGTAAFQIKVGSRVFMSNCYFQLDKTLTNGVIKESGGEGMLQNVFVNADVTGTKFQGFATGEVIFCK